MRQPIIFLLSLIALASSLPAQQDAAGAADPGDVLRFDADHRSRFVYWDEGLFPRDGWVGMFSRHRTRAGVTWTPTAEWRMRAVLANEFFSWYRHRDKPAFSLDELFFDNLFVQWMPSDLPLSVIAGRQNMRFGDGFIIMDGGPLDGSRSMYFNALRVDVQPSAGNTVTLFAMHQPVQDDFLPRVNDRQRALQEAPIDAAGVHFSTDVLPVDLSVYYLAAHAEQKFTDALGGGDITDMLHTPGLRMQAVLGHGFRATAEGAFQGGARDVAYHEGASVTTVIRAWAWHASLLWVPDGVRGSVETEAGMYQYSGGYDPGPTGVSQSWNPLFGRWPIWSESFIYTLVSLRGAVAKWSNIAAPFLRVRWAPAESVSLRCMLQQLRTANLTGYRNAGPDIGTLAIGELRMFPGSTFSGHLLLERMWYAGDHPFIAADGYWWGRVELMYRWP